MLVDHTATTQDKKIVDDLFFDRTPCQITASDEDLAALVHDVELPVLLAALAAVTGDAAYVPETLRPPITPVDTAPHPHGGLSQEQQDIARELGLSGLRRLRDMGAVSATLLSAELTDEIIDFISGGHKEWAPTLHHELNVSQQGAGAPRWHADTFLGSRAFDVLVVGAGVAGIAAGHRYLQAGLPVTMIEAASGIGGTWLKNKYPGVRLDTPTFGYSYSFAQKSNWPNQFAQGGEILEYLEEVADRVDLIRHIEFETKLVSAAWNESTRLWDVVTVHGGITQQRQFAAIVSAVGQLDHPNIPSFPGLDTYQGQTVHSQEWTEDITCEGKRIAVIGTGASAFQIVPAIADAVSELVVFQRSAPWMLPAPSYHEPMTESFQWFAENIPNFAQWYRLWVVLAGIPGRFHTVTADAEWQGAPYSVSAKNQEVRDYLVARLRTQFSSRPELAEIAIPSYPPGAKRMLRDNGVWAEALLRESTTVVTSGVSAFTKNGIIDGDGVEHEVDLVIFATGFTPSDYLDGIDVLGVGKKSIHEYWQGDARAYNGVMVPGFPNFFMLYGPNVGGVVAGSLHFMLERAVEFSLEAIHEVLERDADAIDVTEEALQRFVSWVDSGNRQMSWGQPYVSTWYQNSGGRVSQVWPYTNAEYFDATEKITESDHLFL